MKYSSTIISISFLFFALVLKCQENIHSNNLNPCEATIMFYNVENLFDIKDDPEKFDEEFTPSGQKRWTYERFLDKINKIYKVIIATGQWQSPAIIGLAEIENRWVLDFLVKNTPLQKQNYGYVHFESPDERGIDVALLYRKDVFNVLITEKLRVDFPDDLQDKTRDILYLKGDIFDSIELHVFVNHWPSRSGGVVASQSKRNFAARRLKSKVDSVLTQNCNANILIMGDLNDEPTDASITRYLMIPSPEKCDNKLINLMSVFSKKNTGTLKYKDQWYIFDQLIVTKNMLKGKNKLRVKKNSVKIIMEDFNTMRDEKYLGIKPFRTYIGPQYIGGYSDHFPICFQLIKEINK